MTNAMRLPRRLDGVLQWRAMSVEQFNIFKYSPFRIPHCSRDGGGGAAVCWAAQCAAATG